MRDLTAPKYFGSLLPSTLAGTASGGTLTTSGHMEVLPEGYTVLTEIPCGIISLLKQIIQG